MGKLSDEELVAVVSESLKLVKVGGMYIHYKNPDHQYKVLQIGLLETSNEPCVIYQALYGAKMIWVRPLRSWLEEVEFEGKRVKRFERV
jgi:hypothetical protein